MESKHTATESFLSANRVAPGLRGFGPIGILAIGVILASAFVVSPLGAILVLVWARLSRTPWRAIGYIRPRSWIRTVAVGVAFGAAFKLLMKAVVMPLFQAAPINAKYHYLAGNTAALPGILATVIIGGGFAEETFYRGYLFERLGRLLGSGVAAKTAIVVLTSALFAAAHHVEQGIAGVEQAAITGLVFGSIFAATGQIWLPMIAHAAFDIAAIAIIYWNVESAVAHFFF